MAIQTTILTKTPKYAGTAKKAGVTEPVALQGKVGTLALGKAGDIITRAYGPVIRAYTITTDTAEFGTYVAGKGILVNSNDCEAVGNKLETVTNLKKGQVGSFLVSGACVAKKTAIPAIYAAMKVQYIDPDYNSATSADTDVFEIEVNGFDNDVTSSTAA